jgi:putative PIN family toxin of toxin-antitoxin system
MLLRLVVDTNVWISALLNPNGLPARIKWALQEGLFILVMSEPLFTELEEVLERPRFSRRYGITPIIVSELVQLLRERSEVVPVTGTLHLCRDPDDDVVIETALVGHANALVTRDDDLKSSEISAVLAARGVAALTVRRLVEVLEA